MDWRLDTYWNQWVLELSSLALDDAIYYAGEGMNSNIITFSFLISGSYPLITGIQTALDHVYDEHNVLIVAAAGNEGYNDFITFPASDPNVIAVGATDQYDNRALFPNMCSSCASNCGAEMELCAPGKDIRTLDDNSTDDYEGTSMSAPMVAATAALVLSVNPDLSNEEVRNILKITADKVGSDPYNNGWNSSHGFGRINTYAAVCEALGTLDPIVVDINKTFDSPVISLKDIHVLSGKKLTITSTLYMGPEARLIIEQGGEVEINGGTITNFTLCGNDTKQWPGIEVWGTTDESQYTGNTQGKLVLENATIENAISAVELWKPNDFECTGGIINASNSVFRNNTKSIHAAYYRNFNPYNQNVELDYCGNFTNCTFQLDENYFGNETFYKHVDLAMVKGIKFYGCSFSLSHNAINVSQWNLGIAAYNAGFSVNSYCPSHTIPCEQYDYCTFNGFYWAIGDFSSSVSIYPASIYAAHFDDNYTGIYISSAKNVIAVNNYFEVGYDDQDPLVPGFNTGIGINVEQGAGFKLENNQFLINNAAEDGTYAGIRVYNCPSIRDIIYRNEFDGLSYGNYAEGTNRSNSTDDNTGVEYQCNVNHNNVVDFCVTADYNPDAMIRCNQGNLDTASGNVFSYNATWHLINIGTRNINWFWYDRDPTQEPVNYYESRYITPIPVRNSNDCADHYAGGSQFVLNQEEQEELEVIYADNLVNYNSVNELYVTLTDGGNTESELTNIQTANPDDMWELRSHLLGISPHLSQQVLRAATEKQDVFPDEILLEILSANPDELRKDTLLNYLENMENPLPDYMMEILEQSKEQISYKTILESELSYYFGMQVDAAQDIIRGILHDSAYNATDYRNWMDNLGGQEADRQIIASYLHDNDTVSARALLNLMPTIYNLNGIELNNYEGFKSIIEMQIQWMNAGKSVYDLDSNDISALEGYALDGNSIAGNIARNILTYAYNHHYDVGLISLDTLYYKNSDINNIGKPIEDYGLNISVDPNPASSWITFTYVLPLKENAGTIKIYDSNGKIVDTFIVTGKNGQMVKDLKDYKAGVYYYNLSSSGFINTGKFIVK